MYEYSSAVDSQRHLSLKIEGALQIHHDFLDHSFIIA